MEAAHKLSTPQALPVNGDHCRLHAVGAPGDTSRSDGDAAVTALLAATAGADREAFAKLYKLTSARLFAIALRVTRQRELAEEVLQDAYVSIWERAGQQSRGRGSAMGWMMTIVRHRAIDRVRARAKTREISNIDDAARAGLDLDPLSGAPSVDMSSAIQACLEMLPGNHRRAVLYAFYYGFTHEELAEQLGVPLGTAKSWVRRGLIRLRALLER